MKVLEDAKDSITSVYVSKHEIIAASVDGNVRTYDIRRGQMTSDCIGIPTTFLYLTFQANLSFLQNYHTIPTAFSSVVSTIQSDYSTDPTVPFSMNTKATETTTTKPTLSLVVTIPA